MINEEVSKNDPIPELSRISNKLGIILVGPPASGKSTFFNNYIIPRNRNIKSFSTDDVSFLKSKGFGYQPGSSKLNIKRLESYLSSGQNFTYDTTGAVDHNIYNICQRSREFGYKIIFVHVFADLEISKKRNYQRDRKVDDKYLELSSSRQSIKMKEYYHRIDPDKYYIVISHDGEYEFGTYDGYNIAKRKLSF